MNFGKENLGLEDFKGTVIEKSFKELDIIKTREDDLIKGGEGSKGGNVVGHTKSGNPIYDHKQSIERHGRLVKQYEQAKGIKTNFDARPPKDYQGMMNHKNASNAESSTRKQLREHVENHYKTHKELLDTRDPELNSSIKSKIDKK